jgi:hypothetical protein
MGIAMQPRRLDAFSERLEGERGRVGQQISNNQGNASRIAATGAI